MSKRKEELLRAANLAAEISRIETLAESGQALLSPEAGSSLLKKETLKGPLSRFLREDENPRLALLRAKAELAAFNAKGKVLQAAPRWLSTLVLVLIVPLALAVLAPPIVNYVTARQQLELFQQQKSVEAKRSQADILLGQLASMSVKARELKSDVIYFEERNQLGEGMGPALHNKSVELEQEYRLAVQLHDFESVPTIRYQELSCYYELRALQDCLMKSYGRQPSRAWREQASKVVVDSEQRNELMQAASDEPLCGVNFNAGAFNSFTLAVDGEIAKRIGGSLFPRLPSGESDIDANE